LEVSYQYGSVKGKREKGKGFKYIQIPLPRLVSLPVLSFVEPLTFSQTTREVHTAYPKRIESLTIKQFFNQKQKREINSLNQQGNDLVIDSQQITDVLLVT
jgi:hypothetical protein